MDLCPLETAITFKRPANKNFWKFGPRLFGLLAVSFQGNFFLTVHDLKGPFYQQYFSCCDAGTWRTGAPCIISNEEDFILVQFWPMFKIWVLGGHEVSKEIWPWKVTVSRSNEQWLICKKKSDRFICKSLMWSYLEIKAECQAFILKRNYCMRNISIYPGMWFHQNWVHNQGHMDK